MAHWHIVSNLGQFTQTQLSLCFIQMYQFFNFVFVWNEDPNWTLQCIDACILASYHFRRFIEPISLLVQHLIGQQLSHISRQLCLVYLRCPWMCSSHLDCNNYSLWRITSFYRLELSSSGKPFRRNVLWHLWIIFELDSFFGFDVYTCNFSDSGVFLQIYALAQAITCSYARSFELNVDHTSNWLVQYTAVDVITTLNASLPRKNHTHTKHNVTNQFISFWTMQIN